VLHDDDDSCIHNLKVVHNAIALNAIHEKFTHSIPQPDIGTAGLSPHVVVLHSTDDHGLGECVEQWCLCSICVLQSLCLSVSRARSFYAHVYADSHHALYMHNIFMHTI